MVSRQPLATRQLLSITSAKPTEACEDGLRSGIIALVRLAVNGLGVQVHGKKEEQGQQTFIEVGKALSQIREGNGYRLRVCQELGLREWPRVVRLGMTEDQKREHVLALNLDRRHLTREQRQELVKSLRAAGWSYPRIGDRLHIDPSTAYDDAHSGFGIPKPETTIGKDGKETGQHKQLPGLVCCVYGGYCLVGSSNRRVSDSS